MTGILAIDTATEACSVAVYLHGEYRECFEVIPRQHSSRLFGMLGEVLGGGNLREQGIDAITYGCGPGSFTGLRIAASAVQGLAFACELPCIPVSTLACQAQSALRRGLVAQDSVVFSAIDASIGELYYAPVLFRDSLAELAAPPAVHRPPEVAVAGDGVLSGVGTGLRLLTDLPAALRTRLTRTWPDHLPSARDMVPLAQEALARGLVQQAAEVSPLYVRDEIGWKKLSQQGKRG